MAPKDVCGPWPWKCSPEELSQALRELDQEDQFQHETDATPPNILELCCQEGYYKTPAELPAIR